MPILPVYAHLMVEPRLSTEVVTEVADRVWVAHHTYLHVNATVIGGDRGLLVVDTLWSERAGQELLDRLQALGRGPVVAVVATHQHWDHVLGTAALAGPGVPVYACDAAVEGLEEHCRTVQAQLAGDPDEPYGEDIAASRVVVPDRTFSSVAAVDLGDRVVELVHPGRGHTPGDVVVRVPDADVLVAGDLVEQAAPGDGVAYGPDCFPLDWPLSLDVMQQLLTPASVVVPGHGQPVDADFVASQRAAVGAVAETVFDLASRSVPLAEVLADLAAATPSTQWALPADSLAEAVRRGYAHVPRTARRLPLV